MFRKWVDPLKHPSERVVIKVVIKQDPPPLIGGKSSFDPMKHIIIKHQERK